LSPDGTRLYVAGSSGWSGVVNHTYLQEIDLPESISQSLIIGSSVVTRTAEGSGGGDILPDMTGLGISSDGVYLYLVSKADNKVLIYDTLNLGFVKSFDFNQPMAFGKFILPDESFCEEVAGRVLINGSGFAGVTVNLIQNGQLIRVSKTDSNGNYLFMAPPGSYTVQYIKEGFAFSDSQINITVGNSNYNISDVSVALTLSFTASALQAPKGSPVVLTWASENAVSIKIEPSVKADPLPLSGNATVYPTKNTIYTITATGSGGKTATSSLSISVYSSATFYHYDDTKNVIAVSDANGNIVSQTTYSTFGSSTSSGWYNDKFQFGGKEKEEDLYNFGARYYEPESGQFLSIDPAGPDPKDPQTFNRYVYCLNNPYKYVDPDGEWVESALDIGFLIYDVNKIRKEGYTLENTLALGGDMLGLALPGATGIGAGIRVVGKGIEAADHAAMIAGASKKIVIGENMERVNSYAEKIGAETIDDWLKSTGRGWDMKANKEWINEITGKGYEVFDIGPAFPRRAKAIEQGLRPDKEAYNLERIATKGYDKYYKQFQRSGKYKGGVPGLD
jgi:RHS repeat-associated protein